MPTLANVTRSWLLAALLPLLAQSAAWAEPDTPGLAEARRTADAVIRRLSQRLDAAIAEHGAVATLPLYPAMVESVLAESAAADGWLVRRIALDPRRSENAPNDIEAAVLEAFNARAAAGETLGEIEYVRVADRLGGRFLNFIKALPSEPRCRACHGESIEPALRAAIREGYPGTRDPGGSEGPLLGALTLYKLLK